MKVLVATDGSAASQEAEWFLCRMPFPAPLELTLSTVAVVPLFDQLPSSVADLVQEHQDHAEALLKETATQFEGINGTVKTVVLSGHPADEIVRHAEQNRIELIVLGARGKTPTQRFLLGSVSERVARHAPCSVLVTRPTGLRTDVDRPLRILVGHDGSAASESAIRMLSQFRWGQNVEIFVVSVVTPVVNFRGQTTQAARLLGEQLVRDADTALAWAVEELKRSTPHVTRKEIEAQNASDVLVEQCYQTKADVVFMANRGRSRIERFLLGSTTENVLRHAPCSVWVVRQPVAGTNVTSSPAETP